MWILSPASNSFPGHALSSNQTDGKDRVPCERHCTGSRDRGWREILSLWRQEKSLISSFQQFYIWISIFWYKSDNGVLRGTRRFAVYKMIIRAQAGNGRHHYYYNNSNVETLRKYQALFVMAYRSFSWPPISNTIPNMNIL